MEWVAISFSRGFFSDPGIEPMSPVSHALQADPLSSQGKPVNFNGFDMGKSSLSPMAWYTWGQEELILVHFGCA